MGYLINHTTGEILGDLPGYSYDERVPTSAMGRWNQMVSQHGIMGASALLKADKALSDKLMDEMTGTALDETESKKHGG